MANELPPASTPTILRNSQLDAAEIHRAKVDLAAALRICARLGLHEGIDNHFSAMVPGFDDLFLINPYGYSFAEAKASLILICDFHGNVVAGNGKPEATAFYIHARLHKLLPRARAAFHTHMPYATALAMTEGEPLLWANQQSLKFYGRIAVDSHYNGLALDESEGDRIAAACGDADIIFMKNHGVMVLAPSIAEAFDDLYYLERAAQSQLMAMSTGRKLLPIPHDIALQTHQQIRVADEMSGKLHFEAVKRQLDLYEPDYKELVS